MLRKRTMLVPQIEVAGGNDENCRVLLHFDNDTNNSAINGISGIEASTYDSFVTGRFNQAYKGDNGNPYPILSYDGQLSDLLYGNFTSEMWIETNSIHPFGSNLMTLGKDESTQSIYLIVDILPYEDLAIISISNLLFDEDYNEARSTLYFGSIYSNQLTEWTHIALVVDGGLIKVFINGQDLLTEGYTDSNIPIGTSSSFGSHELVVDEIRFSDIVRYTTDFTPQIAAY